MLRFTSLVLAIPAARVSISQLIRSSSTGQRDYLWGAKKALAVLSDSSDIFENLSTEEALLRGLHLNHGEYLLLLYVNDPCVVIGRNQNVFSEVSLHHTQRDGIPIARRSSGGGAVYHDRGNLCLSFFTTRQEYAPDRTIEVVRQGISRLCGIDPSRLTSTKRSDLFLDGLKISGSAMRVQRDIAFHHCTLLISSKTNNFRKYLHGDGEYKEFRTSAVSSIRSPVTSLVSHGVLNTRGDSPVETVVRSLSAFFETHASLLLSHPPREELPDLLCSLPYSSTDPSPPLLNTTASSTEFDFLYAVGRRRQSGECASMKEEIGRLRSPEWLLNMPVFTTFVEVTAADISQYLAQQKGEDCSEELNRVIQILFEESACISVQTSVKQGVVEKVEVTHQELDVFLRSALVDRCVCFPRYETARKSEWDWFCEGFVMEMSMVFGATGSESRKSLFELAEAILTCLERKNGFSFT